MNKDQPFDPFREFTVHAKHLNAINEPIPGCVPFFDIMSGGFIWPDETTRETPTRLIWALRTIFHYRTKVMFNEPHEKHLAIWNHGRSSFPAWVGFRPERSMPTDSLKKLYRESQIRLKNCLQDSNPFSRTVS